MADAPEPLAEAPAQLKQAMFQRGIEIAQATPEPFCQSDAMKIHGPEFALNTRFF